MNLAALRTTSLLTLLLLLAPRVNAQFPLEKLLYSFNTDSVVTETYQSEQVMFYKDLQVYRTQNDAWDGPRLPDRFPVIEGSNPWENKVIPLDSSLEDSFVFILDTNVNLTLEKDSVYDLSQLSWRFNCRVKNFKQLMIVERFDTSVADFVLDTVDVTYHRNYCFCGNRYNGRIRSILQAVQPYDISEGAYIYAEPQVIRQQKPHIISDSIKADHIATNGVHYIALYNLSPLQRPVVMAHPSSNPYNTDSHFIELYPATSVSERVTINMTSYEGFFMQPHVGMVGSMFDSSQNIRHKLIINLADGHLCLTPVSELVIKEDNELHLNGGEIALKGQRSCTMIRDQASLVIGANQDARYGHNGIGILGLKPGCKVEFEQDASFTIDNMLLLSDYWETLEGGEIDITLNKGNRLSFGSSAWVSNGPFAHGSVTLNIHLKGGTVHLEELDAKSLELINLVYYEGENAQETLHLFPNPSTGLVRWSLNSSTTETASFDIIDSKGRSLRNENVSLHEGTNTQTLDLSELPRGLYFLRLEGAENNHAVRFNLY